MNVRELRKLLALYPPDSEVVLPHPQIPGVHVSAARASAESMSRSIVPGYFSEAPALAPEPVQVVVLAPRRLGERAKRRTGT